MRFRALLVTVLAVLCAAPVLAQTIVPTAYTFRIYQGTSLVGTPLTVPAANVPCDLAPSPGTNLNPTRWRFADVQRAGRECEFPDSARLAALADGDYNGTVTANADNPSAETATVPFVRRRPQTPAVPTGLRIIN